MATTTTPTPPPRCYATKTAARILDRAPHTLRKAHCELGHYCGVTPKKLPAGGLLWPAEEIDALAMGRSPKQAA